MKEEYHKNIEIYSYAQQKMAVSIVTDTAIFCINSMLKNKASYLW